MAHPEGRRPGVGEPHRRSEGPSLREAWQKLPSSLPLVVPSSLGLPTWDSLPSRSPVPVPVHRAWTGLLSPPRWAGGPGSCLCSAPFDPLQGRLEAPTAAPGEDPPPTPNTRSLENFSFPPSRKGQQGGPRQGSTLYRMSLLGGQGLLSCAGGEEAWGHALDPV